MGAIANFKKQREAERALAAQRDTPAGDKPAAKAAVKAAKNTPEPANEALKLLAKLLGVEEKAAIEQAKIALVNGARIIFIDTAAPGEDKTVTELGDNEGKAEVKEQSGSEQAKAGIDASAAKTEAAADEVIAAADSVTSAAENVSGAASDLDDTAKQLAYSAEDIGQATSELKQATVALKKPSAVRQSSRGARAAVRKNNSKK